MSRPPSGTVTCLFTHIEGSTTLWEKYPAAMKPALAQEQFARGTRLMSTQAALASAIGHPLQPADSAENARSIEIARARLGNTAFDAAWEEGKQMTLEQATEYALKETQ